MKSTPETPGGETKSVETFCRGKLNPLAVQGLQEYNAGEYYEAHEYLELAWRDTGAPGRDLYQGILQVGVAYYQILRGNYRGALKMFGRAREKLEPLPDVCQGVDVGQLRRDAERVEGTVRDLGPERIGVFDTSLFSPVHLANKED